MAKDADEKAWTRKQRPGEAGFSLLEVVLAVVLLLLMLLPVSALVSDTSVTVGNQRARVIAEELAQKYLHEAELYEAEHQAFSMCDGATQVDGAAAGCEEATLKGTPTFFVQIVDSFCGGDLSTTPSEPPIFEIGVKVWWGSTNPLAAPPSNKIVVLVGEATTPPTTPTPTPTPTPICLASEI